MAISDAEFERWLLGDKPRCVLVEATAYSGGAEVTRYFANRPYVSGPSASVPNRPYDDILKSRSLVFTQRLSEAFGGRSIPSWGDIVITNEGGARDAWLEDSWDGRRLKVLLGDPEWRRDDFRTVLDGVCADIGSPRRDMLALKIRDKTWMLNVQAQTTLMGGTTANKDQPQPICLGQCFNVEPILEDAAAHRYRVHDDVIEDITDVRDNGVSVAYTKDLSNGRFTLSAAPSGRITADVKGAKSGGTYLTKCADLIEYLVTGHSQLTSADIDTANFTAFNSTCPQALGLYLRDRTNLMDAIDLLVNSVGGFWTFTRAGLLQLSRLEAPSGTPAIRLTADDIKLGQLSIVTRQLPIAEMRLGYKRNWTIQQDGLAGAVSEADRAAYAADYLVAKDTDGTLETTWKLARRPDLIPSLLVDGSETTTEVARRRGLWDEPRTVYRGEAFMAPFLVDLGEVVSLDHPRFGFAGGASAIAVGFTENVISGQATIDLWK